MAKSIEYSCTCGIKIEVPQDYAEMTVQCHECGKVIELNPAGCQENMLAGESTCLCHRCGGVNPTGTSRCFHCGRSVSRGKLRMWLFIPLATLLIGFFIGLFLCPGYLGIVPLGYRLFPEYFAQHYPCMGKWYSSLRQILQKMPQLLVRSRQESEAEIMALIQQIEEYPYEVANLNAAMQDFPPKKLKKIKQWQQKSNHSYARQLYLFNQRGELNIDVAHELKRLADKIKIVKLATNGSQSNLVAIWDDLQKIDKKYRLCFLQIKMAIENFQQWTDE